MITTTRQPFIFLEGAFSVFLVFLRLFLCVLELILLIILIKLRDPTACASLVLGLKTCKITAQLWGEVFFF